MNIFDQSSRILISCQKFLGDILANEVRQMGYDVKLQTPSVVEINGNMDDCIRLNLNLRTASQVLFFIRSFHAENAEELYLRSKQIPWEEILLPEVYFSITGFAY